MATDALGFEVVDTTEEEKKKQELTTPSGTAKVDSLGFEVVEPLAPPSEVPANKPSAPPLKTLPQQEQEAGAELTEEGQIKNRGFIRPSEVQEIADRYQVPAEQLIGLTPYYNMQVEGHENYFNQIGGLLSEAAPVPGIPTWVYKKIQDNPNMRLAIDDLRDLAERQKTKTKMLGELGAGLLLGGTYVKAAGGLGKLAGVASAALTGAGMGLTLSREGEEAKDVAVYAAGGAVLHGAVEGAVKGTKYLFKKVEPAAKEVLENAQKKFATDAEEKIQPVVEKRMQDEAPINQAKNYMHSEPSGQQSTLNFRDFVQDTDSAILREAAEVPQMSRAAEREMIAEMQELGVKETDEASRKAYIAYKNAQEELKEFAQYVSGRDVRPQLEDALSILERTAAVEGKEKLAKLSNDFLSIKTAEKVLAEEADRGLVRDPIMSNFFTYLPKLILDGSTFVSRRIDRVLGTKFEPLLDKASGAQNQFSLLSAQKASIADRVENFIQANNINREAVYDVLNGTRSAETVDALTLQAAKDLRAAFSESLAEANKMGLPISKLENYVPQAMVDLPTALVKMDNMADLIKKETGLDILKGLEKQEYEALMKSQNNNVQQYVKGLSNLTGEPTNNVFMFNKAVKMLDQPAEIGRKWGTVATAAVRREGDIPRFLRETDPVFLYRKWNHNTFRHAFFRDIIDEGKRVMSLAAKAGDRDTAAFLSRWVETMSGGKPSWSPAKALADTRIRWEVGLKRAANQPGIPAYKKQALTWLSETPDIFSMLLRNVHSNVLGWSIKAVIPNLVQPIVMGIPELGGPLYSYGIARTTKAYARLVQKLASGQGPKMIEQLKKEGLLGGKWTGDAIKALDEGIRGSKFIQSAEKGSDKLRSIAMWMYEKTEVLNTLVAKELGNDVSADLIRSLEGRGNALHKQSLKFVESMGAGYRRALDQAISQGNPEEINRLVSDYIKSKVVFNYTRSSLSEFGRLAGPLFSIFLKWPTSVAGDIATRYLEQGVKGGSMTLLKKYLTPLAVFYAFDKLLLPGQKESDVQKTTLGEGTVRMAAVGNVKSILQGDILKPPAVGLTTDAVKSLYGYTQGLEEGNKEAIKAVGNIFEMTMPGASLVRFMTQDVPSLTGKGLPREGSFFEKTQEGLSNLTR